MLGVDLSNFSGEVTPQMISDLDAWGCEFVVVRLSLESQDKTDLATRQIAALSKYIVCGYDWAYPEEDSASAMAQVSIATFPGLYAHFLDVEQVYTAYPGPTAYGDWIYNYFVALPSSMKAGIYTGEWYWTHSYILDNDTSFSIDLPLWNADPDGVADITVFPTEYGGWTKQTIKQYGTGVFGGATLDVNVADDSFFSVPTPAPGPDVTDAQAELNLLDQDIDDTSAMLHARVQKTREDLNYPHEHS